MARKYMTLGRYGGKARMGDWVMDKIMEVAKRNDLHTLFDVFGGGGTISLAAAKITDDNGNPWFNKIYYNDVEHTLVTLMHVLKDASKRAELENKLYATPYEREVWEKARDIYKRANDYDTEGMTDIEIAWAHFVTMKMSFNGAGKTFRNPDGARGANAITAYQNKIKELKDFTAPLQKIELFEVDYLDLLTEIDKNHWNKEAVIYLDPPYIQATRAKNAENVYENELDGVKHMNIIMSLLGAFPYWVLSGYEHSIYTDEIAKYDDVKCDKSLQSKVSSKSKTKGEEYLWYRG